MQSRGQYLGLCENAQIHPQEEHPHWDEYYTKLGLSTPPGEKMSDARWCDFADHPYKAGRPGTTMMGQTVQNPNGTTSYANSQDVKEICPECSAEIGLAPEYEAPASPMQRRAELMAAVKTTKKA